MPADLLGTFVPEVGERQAWPFLTFADNEQDRETDHASTNVTDVSVRDMS